MISCDFQISNPPLLIASTKKPLPKKKKSTCRIWSWFRRKFGAASWAKSLRGQELCSTLVAAESQKASNVSHRHNYKIKIDQNAHDVDYAVKNFISSSNHTCKAFSCFLPADRGTLPHCHYPRRSSAWKNIRSMSSMGNWKATAPCLLKTLAKTQCAVHHHSS